MILVAGHFRIPLEHLDAAREPMRKVVQATHAEDGCLSYAYAEDVLEPGLIRVSEAWRDLGCLTSHGRSAHMAEWVNERAGLGLYDRDIKMWEVGEGKSL